LSVLTNVIATEIIRERLEGRALPDELVKPGVVKSEGNPLFAEEFASYLSQKGGRAEQVGDASFGEGRPISKTSRPASKI
jgi:predicted ATPase